MKASDDPGRKRAVRHLRQLIDAVNHRVPRIERVGEAKIARDAADLMGKALERLKELEESDWFRQILSGLMGRCILRTASARPCGGTGGPVGGRGKIPATL